MITIGQITKPQGVRGEVKVIPMTDDPSRFCVLKSVTANGRALKITNVRVARDAVYIKFDGVCTRDDAEKLRGAYITIDRAAAVPLDDGEFFIADLIGAKLISREKSGFNFEIGVIKSIQSFGAADVFNIESDGGKSMSFSFIKALNAEYFDDIHMLYVDGDVLKSVAVYDDED